MGDGRWVIGPNLPQLHFVAITTQDNDEANAVYIAQACNAHPHLLALLDEVREFLDNYIDVVDGDYGVPRPNAAMSLDSEIQRVLAKARGERWPPL